VSAIRTAAAIVVAASLLPAGLRASGRPDPPAGCQWKEIPEIKVHVALPDGWRFRRLPDKDDIMVWEVLPAGSGIPALTQSRYELRFERLARRDATVARAKQHVENAVAAAVESTPVEQEVIGDVTLFASVGQLMPDAAGVPQLIVAASALANSKTGALYTIRFEIAAGEAPAVLPLGNALFRSIRVDDEM
jgi:hypothetical protein